MGTHAARAEAAWAGANAWLVANILHPVAWATLAGNALRVQQGMLRAYHLADDPLSRAQAIGWAAILEAMGLALSHEMLNNLLAVVKRRKARRTDVAKLAVYAPLLVAYFCVSYGFNLSVDGLPLGVLLPTLSVVALALINIRAIEALAEGTVPQTVPHKVDRTARLSRVAKRVLAYARAHPDESKTQWARGANTSRTTLYRCLRELEAAGVSLESRE